MLGVGCHNCRHGECVWRGPLPACLSQGSLERMPDVASLRFVLVAVSLHRTSRATPHLLRPTPPPPPPSCRQGAGRCDRHIRISLCLCLSLFMSVCLSLSVPLCLCLSVSLSLSVCLSVCLSLFIVSLSLSLSVSLSRSLCQSLSQSVSLAVSVSLCLSLSRAGCKKVLYLFPSLPSLIKIKKIMP